MKISLIHPSRQRPEKAKAAYDYWISKAWFPENIEHVLSLDESDNSINEYARLFGDVVGSCGIVNNNTCVVEATNHAAKVATGDILIYLSDDFKCPDEWDVLINEQMNNSTPMLLKVDDCLQKFNVPVLTIPIMNRKLYEKLGYFWHPEYKSMFVDEHLFWTVTNNCWLKEAPQLKFPHEHCSLGLAERDETYIRSEANWDQGKSLFAKHMAEGFPL